MSTLITGCRRNKLTPPRLSPKSTETMGLTALVIGDCHFKTNNVLATERMTTALLALGSDRRPDFIVMLGDTLDRHETIHVMALTRAITFLKALAALAPTYLLIGNHDRPNNSDFLSPYHPFVGLESYPNLTVVAQVHTASIQGHLFGFVPYVPPGRFQEALATTSEDLSRATAIFAHQEFRGAKMGAITSQVGDVWPAEAPLIISGHIHDYDELQPNLIYIGTPMQHAFGDREDKTVSLFTFEEEGYWRQERIDLRLPKKRVLQLTYTQFLQCRPEDFSGDLEVKLIIRGTGPELKSLVKLKLVSEIEARGVKLAYREEPESIPLSQLTLTTPGQSYYDRLTRAVAEDPELRALVQRLFG